MARRASTAAPARAVLQRTPIWLKDGARDPRVVAFAEAVERRVLSAYGFVLANPSLGAHAALSTRDRDGHIEQWLREWATAAGTPFPWPMFHANAGYAIESLATFLSLGDAPPGTYAHAQVTEGNTRPDLVLYAAADASPLCWLDITARRSVGHVDLKAGPWVRAQNAEILYPSFTDSDFAVMQANDLNPAKPMQMDDNVRYLLATGMTRNRIELEEQDLRRTYLREGYLGALQSMLKGLTPAKRRSTSVGFFKLRFPTKDAEMTEKNIAHMVYAAGATVSVFFPRTASKPVPHGLSKRAGDLLIAELATAANWPDVTLSDERKHQIRLDTEHELFRTSARTRAVAVNLEGGEEERQGKKRKREFVAPPRGEPWVDRPTKLIRTESGGSWFQT